MFIGTPQPPSTTLFPYTTLFRSVRTAGQAARRLRPVRQKVCRSFANRPAMTVRLDRKSTRLNSSHVESSYAVFCLKKKKNVRECLFRGLKSDRDAHH